MAVSLDGLVILGPDSLPVTTMITRKASGKECLLVIWNKEVLDASPKSPTVWFELRSIEQALACP